MKKILSFLTAGTIFLNLNCSSYADTKTSLSQISDALVGASECHESIAETYEAKADLGRKSLPQIKPKNEEDRANQFSRILFQSAVSSENARSEYLKAIRDLERIAKTEVTPEIIEKKAELYELAYRNNKSAQENYLEAEEIIIQQKNIREYLFDENDFSSRPSEKNDLLNKIGSDISRIADINERMARVYSLEISLIGKTKNIAESTEYINILKQKQTKAREEAATLFRIAADCYSSAGKSDEKVRCELRAIYILERFAGLEEEK
jgi:hypothetical protein